PALPSFPTRRSSDLGPRRPGPRLPRITPLNPPKSTCPPAALTAFPAKEAGQTVEGLPAEGQYRWKRAGTQTVASLPGVKLPVNGDRKSTRLNSSHSQ